MIYWFYSQNALALALGKHLFDSNRVIYARCGHFCAASSPDAERCCNCNVGLDRCEICAYG